MAGEGKVNDLNDFYKELVEYSNLAFKDDTHWLTVEDRGRVAELNRILGRKIGYLGDLISELSGMRSVNIGGSKSDMWSVTLKLPLNPLVVHASLICVQATNRAIGKLEYDISKGARDKITGELTPQKTTNLKTIKVPPQEILREVPLKAFISHGKDSAALRKLKEFIETLGIEPIIVKKQASLDKDVPDKVDLYLNQADFVIILATGDDTVKDKITGKEIIQPRQNVVHEIGLAQKTHPGRIIYLLEEKAEFPSNIRPRVWESFKQRNMMNAFLGIVRELRAYGMLKVTKYPIEE